MTTPAEVIAGATVDICKTEDGHEIKLSFGLLHITASASGASSPQSWIEALKEMAEVAAQETNSHVHVQ